ncbi:S-4TM family putative pore-forming effector [Moorena sp. SIO4G3]|uniref:S-4TM family putative pore-forming effector n=1 Tax=Moorena sp. SIO4G3 TaxID=2607821 RepID=UPI00142B0E92|nr:S-4TM family putative pore-forming effector [Moorena sp. SIO4G3]NEO79110.1 hypothetical protein [Moorena sp. SIO4G3]
MNQIPQEQSEIKQLERLAAQRQFYSDAKKIQGIQMVLAVPFALIFSILVAVVPNFQVYAAFWGIAITIISIIWFEPWQKSLQEKAAKIQQLFDCDVLEINGNHLNCESRTEPESIIEASSRHKLIDPDFSKLKNWYPVSVGQLSIELARIICQRSNCWWDAQLRRRYARLIGIGVAVLTIVLFLISLIGGLTLEKCLLAVVLPLLPVLKLGITQYLNNIEAASRLDRLKECAEELWEQTINQRLTPQELTQKSWYLQTKIYDNRRQNPLIFDWIYNRLRRKNEEQMNRVAKDLIDEVMINP